MKGLPGFYHEIFSCQKQFCYANNKQLQLAGYWSLATGIWHLLSDYHFLCFEKATLTS